VTRRRGLLTLVGTTVGLVIAVQAIARTYASSRSERRAAMPGDEVVRRPQTVVTRAITIPAPPASVWPWLSQMGWHRGGWYTARWVDRVLFPANLPSADQLMDEYQALAVGDFVPDGPPESGCGFFVRDLRGARAAGPALDHPPGPVLADPGPGRDQLDVGVRPAPVRRRTRHPPGVPLASPDLALVVDPRQPSVAGAGRRRDVARHAPWPEIPGGRVGAGAAPGTVQRRAGRMTNAPHHGDAVQRSVVDSTSEVIR
jgi:hypothetical protein